MTVTEVGRPAPDAGDSAATDAAATDSAARDSAGAARRAAPYAIIAGGGTGGHVIPALAIAEALVGLGHRREEIHFVGAKRGMERDLVPPAGFTITLLPGRGIARRLTLDNVGAIAGLIAACVTAVALLGRRRPKVVVSVGGFAAAPAVLAAWLWRVPLVVTEQNAVPGLVNRLAARVAKVSAVAFPGTALPRAVFTGNPVRAEMAAVDRSAEGRAAARQALGLSADARVIVVAGGSLGARRLNLAVAGLAQIWSSRADTAIRHVVGARDWDEEAAGADVAAGAAGGLVYQRIRFEDRMDLCYAAADVALQRAGASTVAELAAAGVPSILVPLPGAPGDHQTANARRLADAGAAVVLPDVELGPARLGEELDALLDDSLRLQSMAVAARTLARPRAALDVAALAERFADE